jgi:hypothetical protein
MVLPQELRLQDTVAAVLLVLEYLYSQFPRGLLVEFMGGVELEGPQALLQEAQEPPV